MTTQTPTPPTKTFTSGTSRHSAAASAAQPEQTAPVGPSFLRHTIALARRGLIKTARTPEALIDVTIQPVIFLLLFTYIFGGAVSGGNPHQYLQYLLPGLLGQTIAMAGIALGTNLNTDIEKGVFDRFRSLPIARSAPLVGAVMADFMRYLIVCVVTLGFGYIIGFRVETSTLATVAAIALSIGFALCFCWIAVWIGMIARTPGSVQGIMFLLILPLSFGSSTYVPVATMPGWLQVFVNVNPISHLVNAVRGLMIGGPVATDLLWTFGWMAALLAIFAPLALRAYNRRA